MALCVLLVLVLRIATLVVLTVGTAVWVKLILILSALVLRISVLVVVLMSVAVLWVMKLLSELIDLVLMVPRWLNPCYCKKIAAANA